MAANDPGCVKTCTSKECAELFSPFSSFEGDCQCCSLDQISTRKSDVGVFTQPGPKAVISHNASIALLYLGLLFSSAAEQVVLAAA